MAFAGVKMTYPWSPEFLAEYHKQRAQSTEAVTAYFPNTDDPRFANTQNQYPNCMLRFTVFARCARELGEDDTRCKYQYYRAQCACPETVMEDWMEHRARGTCHLDQLLTAIWSTCAVCMPRDRDGRLDGAPRSRHVP